MLAHQAAKGALSNVSMTGTETDYGLSEPDLWYFMINGMFRPTINLTAVSGSAGGW